MILLIGFGVLCAVIGIAVGKGMRLNQLQRASMIAERNPGHDPDALIDMRSGEVIDPGTRKYRKAMRKGYVRFEDS